MKRLFSINIGWKCLIVLLLSLVGAESYAALNAYLKLKSTSGGKTYTSKVDANGKFTFDNVEPGKYDLIFVLDGSRSQDDGAALKEIEISSFSWGVSNSSGKITKSRSNIQNNRTATVDGAPPTVSCNGKAVATADVDGDGIPDVLSASLVWSPRSNVHSDANDVILHELTVTQTTKVEGACKPSWNLKENVK